MVLDLLLPLRSTELIDPQEVAIFLLSALSGRDNRAGSRRHDHFDLSLCRLTVDWTFIEGSVSHDSTDAMLDGIEKGREDFSIVDGVFGEVQRNDEPTGFDREMKLLPTLRPPSAMFSRRPFSLPEGLQSGRVEKNVKGSAFA